MMDGKARNIWGEKAIRKCPNGIFKQKDNCRNGPNCNPEKCMDMLIRTAVGEHKSCSQVLARKNKEFPY